MFYINWDWLLIQKLLLILLLVIASQVNAEEKLLLCNPDEYGWHKAFEKIPKNSKIFVKFTDTFFSGKKIEYRTESGDWKRWCHDYKSEFKSYKAEEIEFMGNTAICKLSNKQKYNPGSVMKDGEILTHGHFKKMWSANPVFAEKNFQNAPWEKSIEVIKYLNFSKLYQDYSALYTVTDSLGHSDSVRYSGRSDQKLNCEVP